MSTAMMFYGNCTVRHVHVYQDYSRTTAIVERTHTPDLPNEPRFECTLYRGDDVRVVGYANTVFGAIKQAFSNRDVR